MSTILTILHSVIIGVITLLIGVIELPIKIVAFVLSLTLYIIIAILSPLLDKIEVNDKAIDYLTLFMAYGLKSKMFFTKKVFQAYKKSLF